MVYSRAATAGKTPLPGFCRIESGGGSSGMLLMGCLNGGLACQKLAVAALLPLNQNATTYCQ